MLMVLSGCREYIAIYIKRNKNMFHTIYSCFQSAMTQHFCLRSDLMCESHRKKESAFLSDNPWWCHGFPASVCQVLPLECTHVFITGCDKTSVHLCSQVLLCISHLNSCRVNTAFCSNRPVKCNLTLWQPCSSRTSIVTALTMWWYC